MIKDFAGKKTEGYNFVVWIKVDKTNYMIKNESENRLAPSEKKKMPKAC